MKFFKYISILFITILIGACATVKMQVADNIIYNKPNSEIVHSFYLIGDAGNSALKEKDAALVLLEKEIQKANENSTLIFLGDNVYEKGIPKN